MHSTFRSFLTQSSQPPCACEESFGLRIFKWGVSHFSARRAFEWNLIIGSLLLIFTLEVQATFLEITSPNQETGGRFGHVASVKSPRLAEIARSLVGRRSIRLWHDHAFIKPAKDGAETKWHQDFPYWPMNEPGALSCWIALDDVNEKNGCLSFIPGSHMKGRLKPVSLTNRDNIFRLAGMKKKDIKPAVMEMKAGSCTFHDGNTFHYAGGNTTLRPRRALAIIYVPSETIYNGNSHPVSDGLELKVGEPIRGKHFPDLAGK